jgi:hypothetical protein
MNDLFNYQAPDLFAQLSNSPQYSQDLMSLFDDDEEERRRRLGMIGNYNQQSSGLSPQYNFGLGSEDSNQFDMFYL